MNYPIYFDSKKSSHLFELNDRFDFLKDLYIKNKLPNILMLSGQKGLGKSTLINHLLFYIFDKNNYDVKNYNFDNKTSFYNLANEVIDGNAYMVANVVQATQQYQWNNLVKFFL